MHLKGSFPFFLERKNDGGGSQILKLPAVVAREERDYKDFLLTWLASKEVRNGINVKNRSGEGGCKKGCSFHLEDGMGVGRMDATSADSQHNSCVLG